MSDSPLIAYIAENYDAYGNLATRGRRKAKLKLLDEFWALSQEERKRLTCLSEEPESKSILSEALKDIDGKQGPEEITVDTLVGEGSAVGLIIRTEYSDDSAWSSFVEAVKAAEKDLNASDDEDMEEEATGEPSTSVSRVEVGSESESESEEEEGDMEVDPRNEGPSVRMAKEDASLFIFASPPESSPLRSRLSGASNITILRIFNDVTVLHAPTLPSGSRRINPGHRLMDFDGLIEAYEGMTIWIYDERSNRDRAVRLVSLRPDSYGSATGDSWRARASFVPELQLSLASGAMKIDFGGLDRWDNNERQRNLADSTDVQL